jgi:hypothetical protein
MSRRPVVGRKHVANLAAGLTMTGKVRRPPPKGQQLHPHEIEPGRPVPNDWDKHLVEPWAERKARRAAAKAKARP